MKYSQRVDIRTFTMISFVLMVPVVENAEVYVLYCLVLVIKFLPVLVLVCILIHKRGNQQACLCNFGCVTYSRSRNQLTMIV